MGLLKFILGLVALIVLLYIEEDLRGAHAWAVTKAKWEAKGETFDYAKFIPPSVPDEQNLAAIPLFELKWQKATLGKVFLSCPILTKRFGRTITTLKFRRMEIGCEAIGRIGRKFGRRL